MTTVIWLILAIWFWPTDNQIWYCIEAQWSQEVHHMKLTYDAKVKARACDLILKKYSNETY